MSVRSIVPMLMFAGQAEEAMSYYASLAEDSGIDFVQRYGDDFEGGTPGQVAFGQFRFAGATFYAMDSNVEQPFSFTPSISFFITVGSAEEVDRLAGALAADGSVLMPVDSYPFSPRYGWVQDRFGVSWQLAVAEDEQPQ